MSNIYVFRKSLMAAPSLNDVEKHTLTSLMASSYCVDKWNANPENKDSQREYKATYSYIAENFSYYEDEVLRALLFLQHKGYVTFKPLSKYQFKYELNYAKINRDFPE